MRDAGQSLGGFLAGPAGAGLGRLAGSAISTITGSGDYQVALPSDSMVLKDDQVPQFKAHGNRTTIAHREYITDIIAPTVPANFSATPYVVNAGQPATFPWLASLAARFQKYRFRGLVFEFKTLSADYSTGAALGSVILATNYNTNDATFSSKISMENSAFAVSCKPSQSMLHPLECDPSLDSPWKYTRDGINPVSAPQLYDVANVYVATQGLTAPAGTVLGELWATYVVDMIEPIIPPPGTGSLAGAYLSMATNYNTVTSGFGQGPLLNSTTFGCSYLSNLVSTNAGITAANFSITATPILGASLSTSTIFIIGSTVVGNASTSGTQVLGFNRNGNYLLISNIGVLSGAASSPWTISVQNGGGTITATPTLNAEQDSSSTNPGLLITVTGFIPGSTTNVPTVTFTCNTTVTFSTCQTSLTILS